MESQDTGIKCIRITSTTRYPVISAYEHRFLKREKQFRERMQDCTIYFILQKPFAFFNDLTIENGRIAVDIVDTKNPALRCSFDLTDCGFVQPGEKFEFEVMFFDDTKQEEQPFNNVGGFKLFRENGDFIVWESPHKLLYEAICNGLPVNFAGDVRNYLRFHVHYIGKAFSQEVWKRVTKHEKLQDILTMEGPMATAKGRPSFEIALLMLEITGFDDITFTGPYAMFVPPGVSPITYPLDTPEQILNFYRPRLSTRAAQLTSEAEAKLIHLFKPEYNDIQYDKYPLIDNGTRSAGDTSASLSIEKLPLTLSTKHHTQLLAYGSLEL